MATASEGISLAQRREVLQQQIVYYTKRGFSVTSQTDTTAQLSKAKTFSCLWATIWTLCFGIGLVFYLIWYAAKRDELVYIEVDEHGKVKKR